MRVRGEEKKKRGETAKRSRKVSRMTMGLNEVKS